MTYREKGREESGHHGGQPSNRADPTHPYPGGHAPPPPQATPGQQREPERAGGTGSGSFGPEDFPMKEAAPVATAVAEPEPQDEEREPNLAQFLTYVLEKGCSDLHMTTGLPPMGRLHGDLRPIPGFRKLFPKDLQELIYAILTQKQREIFEERLELDVSYSLPGKARFRVNVFQQRDALGTVMRAIPFEIKNLDDLGLPQSVKEFANMRRGLVLVTGITGSGKSTTLAGLIDIVNSTRAEHIMTVEDPIEFLHRHKRSIVNQREVGTDTHSFANALKHVLRQDPDVILVGEMRDLETISTALTAAETGHLVFATLHTQDAPQSIDRVIDVFPPHQQQQIRVQLSATIAGVVSQQLLPTPDGKGRALAAEVLFATPAVRNLIREGKTHQIYTSMQAGGKFGMQVMDQHLADLVKKGKVNYETALERCHHVEEFNRLTGRG
jgi:twitching motility protein PilT